MAMDGGKDFEGTTPQYPGRDWTVERGPRPAPAKGCSADAKGGEQAERAWIGREEDTSPRARTESLPSAGSVGRRGVF